MWRQYWRNVPVGVAETLRATPGVGEGKLKYPLLSLSVTRAHLAKRVVLSPSNTMVVHEETHYTCVADTDCHGARIAAQVRSPVPFR